MKKKAKAASKPKKGNKSVSAKPAKKKLIPVKSSAKKAAKPAPKKIVKKPVSKKAAPAPPKAAAKKPSFKKAAPAKKAVAIKVKTQAKKPAPKPTAKKPVAQQVKPVAKTAKSAAAPQQPPVAADKNRIFFDESPAQPSKPVSRLQHDLKIQKVITLKPQRASESDKDAKLTKTIINELKARLIEMKNKIIEDVSGIEQEMLGRSQREASGDLSGYGIHLADSATDTYDRELSLRIAGNEQEVLYEIDEALKRIEDGTYGCSELSGKPISLSRLRAIPYTRYTLEEAEEIERRRRR